MRFLMLCLVAVALLIGVAGQVQARGFVRNLIVRLFNRGQVQSEQRPAYQAGVEVRAGAASYDLAPTSSPRYICGPNGCYRVR